MQQIAHILANTCDVLENVFGGDKMHSYLIIEKKNPNQLHIQTQAFYEAISLTILSYFSRYPEYF